MATKQKKPASARSKSGASGVSRKKIKEQQSQTELRRRLTALLLLLLAAILFIGLLFGNEGVAVAALCAVAKGLFGSAAFLFPVVLCYIAVMLFLSGHDKIDLLKIGGASLLFLAIIAFIHMFTPAVSSGAFFERIRSYYALYSAGGVFGGLIADLLRWLLGAAFTFVALALFALLGLIAVTGVTVQTVVSLFAPGKKEIEDMEQDGYEAADVAITVRGKKFPIDLSIDEPDGPVREPEPEPAMPEPEPEPVRLEETDIFEIPSVFSPELSGAKAVGDILEIESGRSGKPSEPGLPPEPGPEPAPPADEPAKKEIRQYVCPPCTLLARPKSGAADSADVLRANANKIVETLKSFGVETKIIDVSRGPAVTRYELQPDRGVKISRITALSDDISLALASAGVRIEAPIPGKAAIGIEVPNKMINTVYIRSLLEGEEWKKRTAGGEKPLSFALGKDLGGNDVIGDIDKMPHMLIAGSTGSGKSVLVNTLLISLLYHTSPEDLRLIMVDPKMVELAVYNGIPHLLIPVVTDPKKAAGALSWAIGEMERRYASFLEKGVRDISGYNQIAKGDDEIDKLPHIVIIIDELADLMKTSPKEVEDYINRLAAKARAAGMHLVIATQRPDVSVITGTIKANIPSRIAFAVSSGVDSRTILDMIGAEKLLGRGDMLYHPQGMAKPLRVQGCFVSDDEVEKVVAFIKKNADCDYDNEVIQKIETAAARSDKGAAAGAAAADDEDEMLPAAIEFVVESKMASTSMLQRRLKLGYARASRLIDEMELRGIVGPFEGSKPRSVLITSDQWQEMKMRRDDEKQRS